MIASKRTHAERSDSTSASGTKKQKKNVTFQANTLSVSPTSTDSPNLQTISNVAEPSNIRANIHFRYIQSVMDEVEQKNESTQISSLIRQIDHEDGHQDKIKPEIFEVLLSALSNNITKVESNKVFNSLVISIINYEKWYKIPSEKCIFEFMTFLKILCSSLPKWLTEVLAMLISQLSEVSVEESSRYHHTLLMYFIKVFPTSVNLFTSNLSRNYPNKNDTKSKNINYLENLLKITQYCPEFKFSIWSLIVEKTISIDVELQNELDDLDDDIDDLDSDEDEEDNESGSDVDEEEEDEDEEDDDEDDDDEEEEAVKDREEKEQDKEFVEGDEEYQVELSSNIKELSSKLDSMLSIISRSLSHHLSSEELENGDGVNVFNTLMSLFKTHILPTYYTKSIQYLMFHAAQQQPELMDAFLVTLIDISFSPNESMDNKIKSLQYIGSFIARAKKMTKTQIMFVSSYLTSWLNRYVMEREIEVDLLPGGMERFKHFYAAFQALCYIFCFRHHYFKADVEDLSTNKNSTNNNNDNNAKKDLSDPNGIWECDIDKFFQRMIISKFNPLKFCNENVMLMFAKITQSENLVYCYSIIEKNTHDRLRGIMGGKSDSNNAKNSNEAKDANRAFSLVARQQFIDLQSYFPYDPLFLNKYKNTMKDFYIEWREVRGDYETDDSDDENDDDDKDTAML